MATKNSTELCLRLAKQLPLAITDISDVQSFLSQQGLTYSDIIIEGKSGSNSTIMRQKTKPFDSYIQCGIDAPGERWLLIFSIKFSWFICFLFEDEVLVEIVAERVENAPL